MGSIIKGVLDGNGGNKSVPRRHSVDTQALLAKIDPLRPFHPNPYLYHSDSRGDLIGVENCSRMPLCERCVNETL